MGIMETLQGMKEYEEKHPIMPMEKKKAKSLKNSNLKTSTGNEGVKSSKTARQQYISFLIRKVKKWESENVRNAEKIWLELFKIGIMF